MAIDFDRYRYVPSLRSRQAEMLGYRELDDATKSLFLPIVVLGQWQNTRLAADVLEKVEDVMGTRPYALDFSPTLAHGGSDWTSMRAHDNAFATWRQLVPRRPNVVPTAMLTPAASVRDYVRQVVAMETAHGQVVLRTRSPAADLPRLSAAIAAVESVDSVLVVLDFGNIRDARGARNGEAIAVINALRQIDGGVRIVVMASSFPPSVVPFQDGAIPMLERVLHSGLGGDDVVIYGDHGSIFPDPVSPEPRRAVPRIDYPLLNAWLYRRHREDDGGYTRCGAEVVRSTDWDASLVGRLWGATKILDASNGDIDAMGNAAKWIAVRVNIHLWRQATYAGEGVSDDDDESDDF